LVSSQRRVLVGAGLEAVAERHDPPDAQTHQKQQQQAEVEGRPLAELGPVYIGESQCEGDHYAIEDVLIAGVLVFEVHRPEAKKDLDDNGANRRGKCSLENTTWRSMDYRQGDTEQPGEPANTDSHPAPN